MPTINWLDGNLGVFTKIGAPIAPGQLRQVKVDQVEQECASKSPQTSPQECFLTLNRHLRALTITYNILISLVSKKLNGLH